MKSKRLAVPLLVSGLALLLVGCDLLQGLRLLSFKKQLADLDRSVKLDDRQGLALRFLKPVLYESDFRVLVESQPAVGPSNQNRQTWTWTFEKQLVATNAEPGNFDLAFTASFGNKKFDELGFSERVLAILPKPLLFGLIRSVGHADINMKTGNITVKWVEAGANDKIELLTKSQITAALGTPFSVIESNLTSTYLYKYLEKTSTPLPAEDKLAWVKFTFACDGNQVLSSEGVLGNLGWGLTRRPGEQGMQVALAFVRPTLEPVALKLDANTAAAYTGQYKDLSGQILAVGYDADAFVAAQSNWGWRLILPESPTVFFSPPGGEARWTFVRNNTGQTASLIFHQKDSNTTYTRFSDLPPLKDQAVKIDPKLCDALVGRYNTVWGSAVIISREDEQLFWRNSGLRTKLKIYPASETNFFFKAVDSPLTFVREGNGEVSQFVLHVGDKNLEAQKILRESDYAARKDSDLQGLWKGNLGKLPLSWKIAEVSAGRFRAELDNPTQGANGQPVSVTYSRPDVKLVVKSGAGKFEGKLNWNNSILAGNWVQGGHTTPVTFRRTGR